MTVGEAPIGVAGRLAVARTLTGLAGSKVLQLALIPRRVIPRTSTVAALREADKKLWLGLAVNCRTLWKAEHGTRGWSLVPSSF